MAPIRPVFLLLLLCLPACGALHTPPPPVKADPVGPQAQEAAEQAKAKAEAKAAARLQQQKDLRRKQHELAWLGIERQIALLEQRLRLLGAEQSQQRAARELTEAKRLLDLFLTEQRPRELEERKISLERSVHRADHAKDEYGELVAMYEADEFAKSTKELVLKRGRRELELADRALVAARQEFTEFEKHTLVARERELRQRIETAEQERRKTDLEAEKVRAEQDLAERKFKVQQSELEEAIAELQTALAKDGA